MASSLARDAALRSAVHGRLSPGRGLPQAYVRVTAKAQVIPPILKQVAHGPVFPSIGFDLKVQPLGSGIGVSSGGLDVADKAV